MNSERIVALFRNQIFLEELSKCDTSETKVDLLSKNGVMISLEEYQRIEQIVRETREKNLSDIELERVSGGTLSPVATDLLMSLFNADSSIKEMF